MVREHLAEAPDATLRSASLSPSASSPSGASASLFIAIGSAPKNAALRAAARESWLTWLPENHRVSYKFFSDAPPPSIKTGGGGESYATWAALEAESETKADMVLQPLGTGYGDKEHNAYGQRARYQMQWALRESVVEPDYFLRIDDDSFLCLHKLLYELKSAPREQFFWGRFWCREGRNRADENFMLFSKDIVTLLSDNAYIGKIIPFDNRVTLGWNFGYWSWVMNLTIFDDQKRIDAQQGLLTEYMHLERPSGAHVLGAFCEKHIFAHHVHASVMQATFTATQTHLMYGLPERPSPQQTCHAKDRSFVPARHSTALPDVRIVRSE